MDGGQALLLVLTLIVAGLSIQVRLLAARVRRVERSFEFGTGSVVSHRFDAPPAGVAGETPGEAPGEVSTAVRAYLAAGKKIDAIRQYRTETGSGLKEAKDAVEAFERGQR